MDRVCDRYQVATSGSTSFRQSTDMLHSCRRSVQRKSRNQVWWRTWKKPVLTMHLHLPSCFWKLHQVQFCTCHLAKVVLMDLETCRNLQATSLPELKEGEKLKQATWRVTNLDDHNPPGLFFPEAETSWPQQQVELLNCWQLPLTYHNLDGD